MWVGCGNYGKRVKEIRAEVIIIVWSPVCWLHASGPFSLALELFLLYPDSATWAENFRGFLIICLVLKTWKQSWRKRMWTWIHVCDLQSWTWLVSFPRVTFLPNWKHKGASSNCLHPIEKTVTPLKMWSSGEREGCLWIISSVFHPRLLQALPVLHNHQGQHLGRVQHGCLINFRFLPYFGCGCINKRI